MARQRLGVALLVPPPVGPEVDGLRRALGDGALDRMPPHLTLIPPVNVPEAQVGDALALLRAAAAGVPPLRLRLGPATTFQPVNPVVYLAVGGDLDGLLALRERAFHPPLARPLTHDFVPHVTLADEMAPERIPAAVAALADYAAEVTVDRVHLLREGPGRVWRPVADAPFAAPAVVGRGGLPVELTTSGLPPPDAAPLLTLAPDADGFAVTARRDGEVVGVAVGWTAGPRCHLDRLVVAEAARRQGVGRHLLGAVEALARARSCEEVEAVRPPAPAADALLTASGWRPTPSGRWRRTL